MRSREVADAQHRCRVARLQVQPRFGRIDEIVVAMDREPECTRVALSAADEAGEPCDRRRGQAEVRMDMRDSGSADTLAGGNANEDLSAASARSAAPASRFR